MQQKHQKHKWHQVTIDSIGYKWHDAFLTMVCINKLAFSPIRLFGYSWCSNYTIRIYLGILSWCQAVLNKFGQQLQCRFHEPSCVGPVVPLASGSALASAFASALSSASLVSLSLALLELRDRSISALAPPISSRVTSKRLRPLLSSDWRNQRHETHISKAFKS